MRALWAGLVYIIRSLYPESADASSVFLLIYPHLLQTKNLGCLSWTWDCAILNKWHCERKETMIIIIITIDYIRHYNYLLYNFTNSKAQQMICMNCWSMTVHFFLSFSLSLSIFLIYLMKKQPLIMTQNINEKDWRYWPWKLKNPRYNNTSVLNVKLYLESKIPTFSFEIIFYSQIHQICLIQWEIPNYLFCFRKRFSNLSICSNCRKWGK